MSEQVSTLKALWNRATEAIEAVKKERKLKQLQLQAEIDIVDSFKSVTEAEDQLEKIIMNQKDADKPSFKAVMDEMINLDIAKKRHGICVRAFKEFFGEEPTYL